MKFFFINEIKRAARLTFNRKYSIIQQRLCLAFWWAESLLWNSPHKVAKKEKPQREGTIMQKRKNYSLPTCDARLGMWRIYLIPRPPPLPRKIQIRTKDGLKHAIVVQKLKNSFSKKIIQFFVEEKTFVSDMKDWTEVHYVDFF